METPEFASFAEFARIARFKRSYVTELKRAGRLVLAEDGKRVAVAASLALIESTADPSKAGVAARHAASRSQAGEGVEVGGAAAAQELSGRAFQDDDDPSSSGAYDGHSTRRGRALADKAEWDAKAAERDYLISMNQLLRAEDVTAALSNAVTVFRTSLENLASTLTPELAAARDEAHVKTLLGEAIEHSLEELARKFGIIARQAEE